jgi:hypothetical protein
MIFPDNAKALNMMWNTTLVVIALTCVLCPLALGLISLGQDMAGGAVMTFAYTVLLPWCALLWPAFFVALLIDLRRS